MGERLETGTLRTGIKEYSGVGNWTQREYLVEESVFISTPKGDVEITATDDGQIVIGPRKEEDT